KGPNPCRRQHGYDRFVEQSDTHRAAGRCARVVSQTIIDSLSEAASTYTGLTVETSLYPAASDHVPFIKADLPAVLTIEGADNTNGNIHSAEDTLQKLDYDFGLEIL